MKTIPLFLLLVCFLSCKPDKKTENPVENYKELKSTLLRGWNTWDNRSILTYVYLPDELALVISLEDFESGEILEHAFTGNRVPGTEKVRTIAHTPDGSFIEFTLVWKDISIAVQSVSRNKNLYVRIIDNSGEKNTKDRVHISYDFFYNRKGEVILSEGQLTGITEDENSFSAVMTGSRVEPVNNSLVSGLSDTIYILCGTEIPLSVINEKIVNEQEKWNKRLADFGDYAQSYNAIQNAINWTVVYDPVNMRPVNPVSRPWSYGWGKGEPGGWVQFCWDNFFVAYMQAIESKELAYNEAIQMCNYVDEMGFVPNYAGPGGVASRDRSQPPVGSMMIREIYKMHPERWFLEKTFDQLLIWNRWWKENRDQDGFLAWGSNPFTSETADSRELTQNNFKAASNESGLDNTPMYDGVEFDTTMHMLNIADVGLMGLYVGDCEALADIAAELGRSEENELRERAEYYRENLKKLWNDDFGLFLNRHIDAGEPSYRISPTNFYALIAMAATREQAERMINEHLFNEEEFWGDWVLPSIARNDTAYTGQDYWRGSIWAPMNFLVYLGLRNYDLPLACKELSEKSKQLLMKEWLENGYIRENYHAETGGAPPYRSEHFYHWGALLGMINMIEEGFVPPTESKLNIKSN